MVIQAQDIGILALGNLLRQDEGVGIHLLAMLREYVPPEIELMDGGTSGLKLLDFIERKNSLLVLDAVDAGRAPGEVVEWQGDDIPRYCTGKFSLHQMSFAEVLYWAHFTGSLPQNIRVIGVQPQSMEWGTELTSTTQQSLPVALTKVLSCLENWGVPVVTQAGKSYA